MGVGSGEGSGEAPSDRCASTPPRRAEASARCSVIAIPCNFGGRLPLRPGPRRAQADRRTRRQRRRLRSMTICRAPGFAAAIISPIDLPAAAAPPACRCGSPSSGLSHTRWTRRIRNANRDLSADLVSGTGDAGAVPPVFGLPAVAALRQRNGDDELRRLSRHGRGCAGAHRDRGISRRDRAISSPPR